MITYAQHNETKDIADLIERQAERLMDSLDRRLMSGVLTQKQYDRKTKALDRWASRLFKKMKQGA